MSLDDKPNVADSEPTPQDKLPVLDGNLNPTTLEPAQTPPKLEDKPVKRKKRGKVWGFGLAGLLLLLGTGGYLLANRPNNQIDLEKLTVPVESENLRLRITASGTIVPVQTVNISPKTQGRVAKLLVKKGDRVQTGQAIALMENRDLQAQVIQAQANLKEALAKIKEAKTSRPEEILQARAKVIQSQAALRQALNGNRPEEINQAIARVNQARADLRQSQNGSRPEEINQARARLIQARATLAQAQNGSRPEEINQAIAKVNQARASLNQSQNSQLKQIEQTQAQLKSAQEKTRLSAIRVQRYKNLLAEGAVAKDKYDEAVSNYGSNLADQQQIEQRLAELQQTRPAEIAQKQAAVDEATFALRQLQNGTRLEEIAQKQAAVLESQQALQQLQNGTRLEEIAQKQAALDEAIFALRQLQNGTRPEEIAQKQADVLQTQAALKQAENGQRPETIEQLNNSAGAAYARLQEAQIALQDSIIRAPFNGIITQKYADEGAFVTPTTSSSSNASATSTAIFAIAKDLEVKALVPEIDISRLVNGQSVEIVADAYPEQVFKGKVSLISPEAIVEQNVTSFEVRVALDTGKEELRSGMNADLTFLANELKNVLAVPTVAIVTQKGGRRGVLVVGADNQPEFREVKIGASLQNKTQILEGLKRGERIFIETPNGYQPDDNNRQGLP
jgi:HlyD family secretion protein